MKISRLDIAAILGEQYFAMQEMLGMMKEMMDIMKEMPYTLTHTETLRHEKRLNEMIRRIEEISIKEEEKLARKKDAVMKL